MRLLIAVTLAMLAGTASADEVITPEAGKPDVVYVGKGWPTNLKDGCVDRGECQLPVLSQARRSLPSATRSGGSVLNRGNCSGAVQGVRDIASMYQLVTGCINN